MFSSSKDRVSPELEYDLEVECKNPAALRKRREAINEKVQLLKNMLRTGDDQKAFNEAQVLLHAYLAAQKVVDRIEARK